MKRRCQGGPPGSWPHLRAGMRVQGAIALFARVLLLIVATFMLLPAAAAAAKRSVPREWLGVHGDGQLLLDNRVDFDRELGLMAANGVESLRVVFDWGLAQPYARAADVPPDQRARFTRSAAGVPTDYGEMDRVVLAAARHGLGVLPVVFHAPGWAARHPGEFGSPPAGTEPYARFVRALVRRYGPRGTLAAENPDAGVPAIRRWQLWNEPNAVWFWKDQPFERDYVALLRAAAKEIRRTDPGARVVLAGLVNKSWKDLAKIYRAGGRRWFDVVAIHPFTRKVENILRILDYARQNMRRYGDARKPLVVTELTWTSSAGRPLPNRFGLEVTQEEQADRLRRAVLLLAEHRRRLRIEGVYWLSWLRGESSDEDVFDYSGLRAIPPDREPYSKPALEAYRRVAVRLEGCRKTTVATRCRG